MNSVVDSLNNLLLLNKRRYEESLGICKICTDALDKHFSELAKEDIPEELLRLHHNILTLQSIYENRVATVNEIGNVVDSTMPKIAAANDSDAPLESEKVGNSDFLNGESLKSETNHVA